MESKVRAAGCQHASSRVRREGDPFADRARRCSDRSSGRESYPRSANTSRGGRCRRVPRRNEYTAEECKQGRARSRASAAVRR